MLTPDAMEIPVTSFTSFDWFLVVVVVMSAVFAFMRGFIRVLFSLVGLAVGTLLAGWYYVQAAVWLHRWIATKAVAEVVGFLAILFAVTIVFGLMANVVRKTAKLAGLGFMDRLLGAAIGVLRGVLLGVAVMMALAAFVPHSGWIRNSMLAPYFLDGAHAVSFVVPQHFQGQLAEGTRHLIEQTPGTLKRSMPMK